MALKSVKNSVNFKSSLRFGQDPHDLNKPTITLTHIYMLTNYKFHISRLNNYSTITDAKQVKGAIHYKTLQGYIIFETDLYVGYADCKQISYVIFFMCFKQDCAQVTFNPDLA